MNSWQNFESNFGDLSDPSRGSFQVTKQSYCVAPKFHSKFCQEFKNPVLKFFSLKMGKKLLKNGLKREYYTFFILNYQMLFGNQHFEQTFIVFVIGTRYTILCYDFKLGVSPKYAIQMGR